MSTGRRNLSMFILLILGLHLVPIVREWTGARETLWPFLSWGMFRHDSRPPVVADRLRIVASTPEGSRLVVPADTGFDRFGFRRFYQMPFRAGDFAPAQELARRLSRRWRTSIDSILVEKTTFTLSREGLRTSTIVRRVGTPDSAGERSAN